MAATSRIARLTSPANGMIIALDPDIPPRAQAVQFGRRAPAPA
ncbi:MAG: hypothetical protein U1F35_23010 [Steroidobacteraceae bacterium]